MWHMNIMNSRDIKCRRLRTHCQNGECWCRQWNHHYSTWMDRQCHVVNSKNLHNSIWFCFERALFALTRSIEWIFLQFHRRNHCTSSGSFSGQQRKMLVFCFYKNTGISCATLARNFRQKIFHSTDGEVTKHLFRWQALIYQFISFYRTPIDTVI